MYKGCSRADPDGLVGGVQIHPGGFGRDQRLGAGDQVGGGQVVRDHLEDRGGAKFTGMQDTPSHRGQQRQDPLERSPVAAGEDRDIAGIGPVTAAGHRTVHRRAAPFDDQRAQPFDLGLVGRGHFHPDLARPHLGQHFLHYRVRGRRRRQAGNHGIAIPHHLCRALCGSGPVGNLCRHQIGVQIMHHQGHAVAQEAAAQLAPHISKPDKANLHATVSRLFSSH